MKTQVRRVAGQLVGIVREMNEAQRLVLAMRTGTEQYAENPGAAPDTYEEFLARTAGTLLHEPCARKRARRARRD